MSAAASFCAVSSKTPPVRPTIGTHGDRSRAEQLASNAARARDDCPARRWWPVPRGAAHSCDRPCPHRDLARRHGDLRGRLLRALPAVTVVAPSRDTTAAGQVTACPVAVVEYTTTIDRCAETSYPSGPLMRMRIARVWCGSIRAGVGSAAAPVVAGVLGLLGGSRAPGRRLAGNERRARKEVHHE